MLAEQQPRPQEVRILWAGLPAGTDDLALAEAALRAGVARLAWVLAQAGSLQAPVTTDQRCRDGEME